MCHISYIASNSWVVPYFTRSEGITAVPWESGGSEGPSGDGERWQDWGPVLKGTLTGHTEGRDVGWERGTTAVLGAWREQLRELGWGRDLWRKAKSSVLAMQQAELGFGYASVWGCLERKLDRDSRTQGICQQVQNWESSAYKVIFKSVCGRDCSLSTKSPLSSFFC